MSAPKLSLQRIAVDAQGYDETGAYWGAGPTVFIGTTADASEEITVRARTAAEARKKIATELGRKPGRPAAREALGGKSPAITRYKFEWHDAATAVTHKLKITYSRDYIGMGRNHLEIESVKRTPLPITASGYRSHFIDPLELINAGGPVDFVRAWLERESQSKAWRKAAATLRQGDLFQWAETSVTRRSSKPRASQRHVVPDADHIATVEQSSGEGPIRKRMKQRDRGKAVKPPKGAAPG